MQATKKLPEVQIAALDKSGAQVDMSELENMGVAYDPTQATLDLTKDEKRRTTALLLAIQAYNNLIIKDADYLVAACREADRGNGPVIRPATMTAMVEAAINFDRFISGALSPQPEAVEKPKDSGDAPQAILENQ